MLFSVTGNVIVTNTWEGLPVANGKMFLRLVDANDEFDARNKVEHHFSEMNEPGLNHVVTISLEDVNPVIV